jgi:nicotinamide riboside kinase
MRIVNLFAGPGTGKSTTAAALFTELKYRGINCEYIPEYAKDAAWEGRGKKFFRAQQLIYGKQSFRIERVAEEVDLMVTDCPLMMGLVYMPEDYPMPSLRDVIVEDHDRYDNLNIFLKRNKPFNPKGRNQNEAEAKELDRDIRNMLIDRDVNFHELDFSRKNVKEIIRQMINVGWANDIPALLNK